MFLAFKNGVKSIQIAGYNGARVYVLMTTWEPEKKGTTNSVPYTAEQFVSQETFLSLKIRSL